MVRSWLRYFAFWDGSTDSSQALRGSQSRGKLAFRFPMPGSVISAPAHAAPIYLTDNTYVWQIQIYSIVLDDLLPRCRRASTSTRTGPRRRPAPTSTGCMATTGAELPDGIFGEDPSRIPTPVYNANPNGAAVQHWGQEWRIGTRQTGSGPRVETNTLQKYTDRAITRHIRLSRRLLRKRLGKMF